MNHEPLDRLHLQQIAAAYAAGYRMAGGAGRRCEILHPYPVLPEIRPWYGRPVGRRGADRDNQGRNTKQQVPSACGAHRTGGVAKQPRQLVRQTRITRNNGKEEQTMGETRRAGRDRSVYGRRGRLHHRRGVRATGCQHKDADISARTSA